MSFRNTKEFDRLDVGASPGIRVEAVVRGRLAELSFKARDFGDRARAELSHDQVDALIAHLQGVYQEMDKPPAAEGDSPC